MQTSTESGGWCSALSSTSDPIRVWHARTRLTWIVAAPAVLAAAAWAIFLPAPALVGTPDLSIVSEDDALADDDAFDLAVFSAPLWVEPPVVVAEASQRPPPAPPPVTLQLLAVVSVPGDDPDTSTLQAAIYDPESDRLLFVSDGERVGRFTVTAVNSGGTTLTDGAREVTLSLAEGRP